MHSAPSRGGCHDSRAPCGCGAGGTSTGRAARIAAGPAGTAWRWLVDLSGIFLTIVAITGIGILRYLRKVRTTALATMAAGVVVMVLLMKLAI